MTNAEIEKVDSLIVRMRRLKGRLEQIDSRLRSLELDDERDECAGCDQCRRPASLDAKVAWLNDYR